MQPRVSFITLGISDLDRSVAFYRGVLELPLLQQHPGVAFFDLGTTWLGLFHRTDLAADAGIVDDGQGFARFSLSHNVATPEEVDALLNRVAERGARVLRPAGPADWGGRIAYFADPDGFLWEIAWNPHFPHV